MTKHYLTHDLNCFHYDSIVQSWQFLMGDNFHWGYFEDPEICLDEATVALIDLLASFLDLKASDQLLDIGCGIGEPAMHLHRQFGCRVVGISNSPNGIARATELASERGYGNSLVFHVRDALQNGLPERSFDAAWLMEMSHLIQDKQALINEAARCVRPGGRIALCDLTFNRRPLPREIFAHLDDHKLLKRAFGEAQLETLEVYQQIFQKAGLTDVQTLDISSEVIPTLHHWRTNAQQVMRQLTDPAQIEPIADFSKSCDILERFYKDGTWGYGCIVGKMPA